MSPTRQGGGLDLNSTILDPSQLTASIGLVRDMELLARRLQTRNGDTTTGEGGFVRKGDSKEQESRSQGTSRAEGSQGRVSLTAQSEAT